MYSVLRSFSWFIQLLHKINTFYSVKLNTHSFQTPGKEQQRRQSVPYRSCFLQYSDKWTATWDTWWTTSQDGRFFKWKLKEWNRYNRYIRNCERQNETIHHSLSEEAPKPSWRLYQYNTVLAVAKGEDGKSTQVSFTRSVHVALKLLWVIWAS